MSILRRCPWPSRRACPSFADRDTALAYAHVHETPACTSAPGIALACGTRCRWDGRAWTIGHVGETTVGLRGEGSAWTEVPLQVFETLVKQGKLTGLAPEPTQAQRTVTRATPQRRARRGTRGQSPLRTLRPFLMTRRSRRQGGRSIAGWHGIARRNVSTAMAMSASCRAPGIAAIAAPNCRRRRAR